MWSLGGRHEALKTRDFAAPASISSALKMSGPINSAQWFPGMLHSEALPESLRTLAAVADSLCVSAEVPVKASPRKEMSAVLLLSKLRAQVWKEGSARIAWHGGFSAMGL